MIITFIFVFLFGLLSTVDSIIGSLLSFKAGGIIFVSMLQLLDTVVYWVRSIFPVTISTLFQFAFTLFSIFIVLKFIGMVKSMIPLLNNIGGNQGSATFTNIFKGAGAGLRTGSKFPYRRWSKFSKGSDGRIYGHD